LRIQSHHYCLLQGKNETRDDTTGGSQSDGSTTSVPSCLRAIPQPFQPEPHCPTFDCHVVRAGEWAERSILTAQSKNEGLTSQLKNEGDQIHSPGHNLMMP